MPSPIQVSVPIPKALCCKLITEAPAKATPIPRNA